MCFKIKNPRRVWWVELGDAKPANQRFCVIPDKEQGSIEICVTEFEYIQDCSHCSIATEASELGLRTRVPYTLGIAYFAWSGCPQPHRFGELSLDPLVYRKYIRRKEYLLRNVKEGKIPAKWVPDAFVMFPDLVRLSEQVNQIVGGARNPDTPPLCVWCGEPQERHRLPYWVSFWPIDDCRGEPAMSYIWACPRCEPREVSAEYGERPIFPERAIEALREIVT